MLSSFLLVMINLSKTSSPQKLFDNDCVTLYEQFVYGDFSSWDRQLVSLGKHLQGGQLFMRVKYWVYAIYSHYNTGSCNDNQTVLVKIPSHIYSRTIWTILKI